MVTKKLKITRQRIMILKKALVPATRFWTTKSVFFGVSPPLRKWSPDEVLLWLENRLGIKLDPSVELRFLYQNDSFVDAK